MKLKILNIFIFFVSVLLFTSQSEKKVYENSKTFIKNKRVYFQNELKKSNVNKTKIYQEVGKYFDSFIVNEIFTFWYGTPWDFNGHTDTPNTKDVACGYFVSTTLKHCGMNLNRYKMAQKGAKEAIVGLCGSKNLTQYLSIDSLKSKLKSKQGLFVVGLDFHIGFLWVNKNEIYFIHSNYINRIGVVKESINQSLAFKQSKSYWVAPIGNNSDLMHKWLLGELIKFG